MDGNEVVGAKAFCEFGSVAFIGFDAVAGAGGNEGRGDDFALNAHLKEASRNPKATATGFVADVEFGELPILSLGDASHGALEGMLRGGDVAVMPRFAFALRVEDGDGGFFFVNVESEVECARCA